MISALQANIVDLWRKHFVMTESMLEMECTNLTPYSVLETSGHVERFTDLMVKDLVSGEPFRADKLLEDYIDTLLEENPTMDAVSFYFLLAVFQTESGGKPVAHRGSQNFQEKKEEHRRVQRQADAYSPEELVSSIVGKAKWQANQYMRSSLLVLISG
jgi:glycyl-tRNA synthetase